ncbi:glycine cleavage system aminomethyltransferase GcvT [Opitutales bacterium ASA1]|nr:glycine cleavage system aminomethyltransferase GcvT [Opitutales bacterium ASA1]
MDFAGWEMPVQYKSILEEHRAVRTSVGLFDVSHMGEIVVRGPDAGRFLDHLVTNEIAKIAIGRVVYSPMCREDGGVVDDLLVSRRSEQDYLVCVNASNVERDYAWMRSRADDFDCAVDDQSDRWGLLAVQGPNAPALVQELADRPLDGVRYYHCAEAVVGGVPCLVSRTGYTGEPGYELFCPADETEALAVALEKAGAAHGLALCGLGARDSLRLEAGFSLYGHEISETISPIQAGLEWTVKFAKPAFVGREALLEQKTNGTARRVVFFKTGDRRIVRAGTPVLCAGSVVGEVLSGTLSPMLGEAMGSALIDTARLSDPLSVDLRGQPVALCTTKPPFVPLRKS